MTCTWFLLKAVFELAKNRFWKSFSVKPTRWQLWKINFPENNFRLIKICTCWPGNDFTESFYLQMISVARAKERESHRKKKPTWTKHTQRKRERTIGVDRDRDHQNRADRRRSWLRSTHRAIAPITRSRLRSRRSQDRDCDLADRDRADLDHDLTEKMWYFLGFICIFRNEWYYVFVW